MPCMTADGLSMVIVTLPAFAVSEVLSNLNAPPGSADSLSVEAPPLGAFVGVAFVGVVEVALGAPDRVDAEGAGVHAIAVVADAPELVDGSESRLQPVDIQPHGGTRRLAREPRVGAGAGGDRRSPERRRVDVGGPGG